MFWESVVLTRKVAVQCIAAVYAIALLTVMVAALIAHAHCLPYEADDMDMLELGTMSCSTLALRNLCRGWCVDGDALL